MTAFLAMPAVFMAQHCDSINNHFAGWFYQCPTAVIQLGDGNLLCQDLLFNLDENGMCFHDENGTLVNVHGYQYYWISSDGLAVTDSLFVPCDNTDDHLWTRLNPTGDKPLQFSNIDACVVSDGNASFLKIAFFDDLMNFNDQMEVNVPLCDHVALIRNKASWLLDSNNDIIVQYMIPDLEQTRFARFGLDGTLKIEKTFSSDQMPCCTNSNFWSWQPYGLRQFSDSPVRYNYFGQKYLSSGIHVIAFELDQNFEILNSFDLTDQWGYYPATINNGFVDGMVSLDDGGALFVRNTEWSRSGHNESTGVLKYDAQGNILKEVWFNPFDNRVSFCTDLSKDRQGFVYLTLERGSSYAEGRQVAVIKMDQDLNVIWEYSGMNFENVLRESYVTALLDNEAVAVVGQNYIAQDMQVNQHVGLFLTLLSKEKTNVGETAQSLRPYLCYPNPVEDRLNIHYSPDVKPSRVEILDLQGRLLGTQKGGLESVDMQNLPDGTYTLRLTLDNGKTYSDRIVKQ